VREIFGIELEETYFDENDKKKKERLFGVAFFA